MSEAKDLRDIKQFNTGNKVRDLIIKQVSPTIQKVEAECESIRSQMRSFRQNYNNVLKFDYQRQLLDKNIKQFSKQLFELKHELAALKSDTDLAQALNKAAHSNIKEEIDSFERGLARREETLLGYDKKLNGMMDTISKHQNYVGDRLIIFEEKFKKLSKQTLEMSKDLKKDFDSCNLNNQVLKNQLTTKLKLSEERQGVLDLFLAEREENTKKIIQIQQSLQQMVKARDFEQFRRVQQGFMEDRYEKITSFLENTLPAETLANLKQINVKFAEIQELKLKSQRVEEEVKRSIRSIERNIKSIEQAGQEKMAKMRTENEEIEDKIIEEIDKRFETIEENIQQKGTQTELDIQSKLKELKENLEMSINLRLHNQDREIAEMKAGKTMINERGEQQMISKELETAKAERQRIQGYGKKIKEIAEGLNDKLVLFSNKITMCRSDIEIFVTDTKKQLKKISSLKQQLQNNMENVGKLLASIVESITILVSLGLSREKHNERNVFATFHDGLVLQIDACTNDKEIMYRRHLTQTSALKQSLLYCLLTLVDENILNNTSLKWDVHKPSEFYRLIKENLDIKNKAVFRNSTLSIHSPKKRLNGKVESNSKVEDDDSFFELKKSAEENLSPHHKSRVTVAHANTLWPLERPNSEVQKRYKMKKPEDLAGRRQSEERHCFTASRSHRKTKISYV